MATPSPSWDTSYDFNADFVDLRTASDGRAGDYDAGWNIEGDMYPQGLATRSHVYTAHTPSVAEINRRCVTPASYQNFAALASDPQPAMPSPHKHSASPASAAGDVDYSDICWVNPFASWHTAKAISEDAHAEEPLRVAHHPTRDILSTGPDLSTSHPLGGVAHHTPLIPLDPRTPYAHPLPDSAPALGSPMALNGPFVVGKTCEEEINALFRSLPRASNGELLNSIVV
ncbi:uncharacterized protein SCHCODRAFT_02496989 [Schizophyllum commune H4-8]|nr:uncharacterized protein SCHCODRAFT_02496989 [Schizophyllum commune H4-8]KAI5894573.1 hypothetical protein SCHCODRAFT_02496989 [Schizophyllum commune H4-8]